MNRYKAIFSALSEEETSEQLRLLIENSLQNKFVYSPETLIKKRIDEEWNAINKHQMLTAVAALYDLTAWLKFKQYPYRMKYAAGSSLILYLLGITSGNPLPCDLGGFDIPWQSLWGYGNSYTALSMALPATCYHEIQGIIPIVLNDTFLKKNKYCTRQNELGIREIYMSKVILLFGLEDNIVAPEFYKQHITPSDYMIFIKNWKRYVSYELMHRYSLPYPNDMADLITLRGMGAASGAVDKDTAFLISTHNCNISDMIVFRDDVYSYLISHGFSEEDAWRGSKSVGSGRGLPFITSEMESSTDKWKLAQCKKVRYLPAKAEIVENLIYEHKYYALSESAK